MRVRLTRKLAERIDGVDLTGRAVGDVLNLPDRDALCIVSEGWAVPEESIAGSADAEWAGLPDEGCGRQDASARRR